MSRSNGIWIPFHAGFFQSRKLYRLCEALQLTGHNDRLRVQGHLANLWCWILDQYPNGIIEDPIPGLIAEAAKWQDDPEIFLNAIIETSFFHRENKGKKAVLVAHGWDVYGGKLATQREKGAERARIYAQRKKKETEKKKLQEPDQERLKPQKANLKPVDLLDEIVERFLTRTGEWGLTQRMLNEFETTYKDMNVRAEMTKAVLWCQTNPAKRKTDKGMPRFLTNWLGNAHANGTYQLREKQDTKDKKENARNKSFRSTALADLKKGIPAEQIVRTLFLNWAEDKIKELVPELFTENKSSELAVVN